MLIIIIIPLKIVPSQRKLSIISQEPLLTKNLLNLNGKQPFVPASVKERTSQRKTSPKKAIDNSA